MSPGDLPAERRGPRGGRSERHLERPQRRRRGPGPERRRTAHSMETVLEHTVALLDEAGESALTFRALAARLGGGVASIYWYVDSKEQLLSLAADHVVGEVLDATDHLVGGDDPIAEVRAIAVTLFDVVEQRPWLASYFMTSTALQENSVRLYDRIGRPLLGLRLTPLQRFHAASAVVGFVIGTAADLGQQPPPELLDGTVDRDAFLEQFADEWRKLDPAEYPFIHSIVEEFAGHDDTEQFRAGLDLLLAGLRLQAGL